MDFQNFKKEIALLNPEGNIESAYDLILTFIQLKKVVDGGILNHEYVINKYAKYVKSWNIKFAKKEASGYLAKADALKTIYEFVNTGMYKQDFKVSISNYDRDKYLFGDNFELLYEKVLNARKTIQKEKEKLD